MLTFLTNLTQSTNDLLTTNPTCKDGTDPYCISCGTVDTKTGCQLCAASYIDQTTLTCKLPSSTVDFCGTYDPTSKKCVECIKGYFVSSDGFCVDHKLDGCLDPLSQTECRECDGLFIKEDKTCDLTASCTIEGCSTCENKDGKEVCLRCHHTHAFSYSDDGSSSNSCVEESNELEGCSVVKDGKCTICKFGYYVGSKEGEDLKCLESPAYESQMIVKFLIVMGFVALFF
jgi:hypothetical protein